MSWFNLIQATILLLVLLACMLHLYAKFAPESLRRLRGRLALRINGEAAWRRHLSLRLRPPARIHMGGSSSCGGCSDKCSDK